MRSITKFSRIVVGMGLVFAVLAVGEVVALSMFDVSAPDGFWTGLASSVLTIFGIIYGGIWLMHRESPVYSDQRIVGWSVAALGGFFLLVIAIEQHAETLTWFYFITIFRWAGSLGAATGLLIGIFEARSIKRALEAERSRLREEAIQQERDRLDEFASIVSHDLRNPLNVAQGRIELAKEECDTDHLDEAENAVERSFELIKDLLVLARGGQEVSDMELVDLRDLVDACWKTVETGNATAVTEMESTLRADRSRLRQLLENLFRNAVEHGSEDVTVKIGSLPEGFYVEDDGTGIPEGERDKVFDMGYSTTDEGTGIGLSLVNQIAEAHGWEIHVTEGSEGGARFEITGVEFADE